MPARSLKEAIQLLESDKLKDRAQGLEDVRLFLSVSRPERKEWLRLLQAIFQIVVDEQRAYLKKISATSNPALKRLRDAAQMVRTIIEQAAPDLPRKSVKAILNHILSVIIVKGSLFEPVALEYLKSLRALIEYSPHLDHLDEEQWTQTVSLCFAAALGDPVRSAQATIEEQLMPDEETEPSNTASTSSQATNSRKRKAAGPLRIQANGDGTSTFTPSSQFRAAGQDVIELMACIDILFKSTSAPYRQFSEALLAKFLRFFRAFPVETSAHLPATSALNRLVQQIFFDAKAVLGKAGVGLWPSILSIWGTKNPHLKEQVVITSSLFLPFLLYSDGPSRRQQVQQLYNTILNEASNRWGAEELDFNCLRLGRQRTGVHSTQAFCLPLLRSGDAFTPAQALSWTILELGARCLDFLQNAFTAVHVDNARTPTSSALGKRRKVETALDSLTDELEATDGRALTLSLELLLFFVSTTSKDPDPGTLQGILSALHPHYSRGSPQTQAMSFLIVATLAYRQHRDISGLKPTLTRQSSTAGEPIDWESHWNHSIRRLSHPTVSRTAALLVTTLMETEYIPHVKWLPDIERTINDIDIQGPPYPCDTSCSLLRKLLTLSVSDSRLNKLNVGDKIFNRLSNYWQLSLAGTNALTPFPTRAASPPFDVVAFLGLLAELATFAPLSIVDAVNVSIFADSPIVSNAIRQSEQSVMSQWYFLGHVEANSDNDHRTEAGEKPTLPPSHAMAVKITAFLSNSLARLAEDEESPTEAFWSTVSLDRLRRTMDVAITAALFDAAADMNACVRVDRNVIVPASLLRQVTSFCNSQKWSTWERAYLLSAFDPVTMNKSTASAASGPLLNALETSGIVLSATSASQQKGFSDRHNSAQLLQRVWTCANFREAMSACATTFRQILAYDIDTSHPVLAQQDDEFGVIRTTTSLQMTGRALLALDNALAAAHSFKISISVLATAEYYAADPPHPSRLKDVVKDLIDGTGMHMALVGSHILQASMRGQLQLATSELDAILERIGSELLPSYEYASCERMHDFVMQFLMATIHQWGKDDLLEPAFADNARRISGFYTSQFKMKSLKSVRLRLRYVELLDAFLLSDLSVNAWGHESEEAGCQEGIPLQPPALLIDIISDASFEVRFRTARAIGRVCSHRQHSPRASERSGTWENIAAAGTFDLTGAGFETNITLLLTYANVMIASEYYRPLAYHPIIIFAALDASKTTNIYVRSLLAATSKRLKLQEPSMLYTYLAPFTMAEQLLSKKEALTILDPTAFGFGSKRELYEAGFVDLAAMVLAGPRPEYYDQMCAYAGITPLIGLKLCLHSYIAVELVLRGGTRGDQEQTDVRINDRLQPVCKDEGTTLGHLFRSVQDLVAYRIFACIQEPDYSLPILVEQVADFPDSRRILTAILGDISTTFKSNRLAPPSVRLREGLSCLYGNHTAVKGALRNEAVLYSVMHRLLSSAVSHPFTSEQLRLLHNAVICIACATDLTTRYRSVFLLTMQRCIPLLRYRHLYSISGRLFLWSMSQLLLPTQLSEDTVPEDLGQVLVEAGTSLHEHYAAIDGVSVEEANRLLLALEAQVNQAAVSKNAELAKACRRALCFWPRRIMAHASLKARDVIRAINDSVTIPNLQVAKVLRELVAVETDHKMAVVKDNLPKLLWQMLDKSDRTVMRLDSESAGALGDLLLCAGGNIQPARLDEYQTSQEVHACTYADVRNTIVKAVSKLALLNGGPVVTLAFDTLRAIFSQTGSDTSLIMPQSITLIAAKQLQRAGVYPPPVAVNIAELNGADVWLVKGTQQHTWHKDFGALICSYLAQSDDFFGPLLPLIHGVDGFAKTIIPQLIHASLTQVNPDRRTEARHVLSTYFVQLIRLESPCSPDVLDLVIYLRRFRPVFVDEHDVSSRDRWLDISWLLCAQAAASCSRYASALMFMELAREYKETAAPTPRTALLSNQAEDTYRRLLYDVYGNIGEPDGFYSISAADPNEGVIRQIQHEGRWLDALSWHSAQLEISKSRRSSADGVASALFLSDMPHTSALLSAHGPVVESQSIDSTLSRARFELAWRAETWDVPLTYTSGQNSSEARLFRTMRINHVDVDKKAAFPKISRLLQGEAFKLMQVDAANPTPEPANIDALMCIRIVEHSMTESLGHMPIGSSGYANFAWSTFERLAYVRLTLLRERCRVEERMQMGDVESASYTSLKDASQTLLVNLAQRARSSCKYQTALNAIVSARHSAGQVEDPSIEFEFSRVLWDKGEHGPALSALKRLIARSSTATPAIEPAMRAAMHAQMGEWVSVARLENPAKTLEHYFQPALAAINQVNDVNHVQTKAAILRQFATFADQQYQQCTKQLPEMQRLEAFSRRKEAEVKDLTNMKPTKDTVGSDVGSRRRTAKIQSEQDRQTVSEFHIVRRTFLETALDLLCQGLTCSDSSNSSVFRMVGLWFENAADDALNSKLASAIHAIPSHKFISLFHQLSARLSTSGNQASAFQKLLHKLITKHTRTAGKTSNGRRSSHTPAESSQVRRSDAAVDILNTLRQQNRTKQILLNVDSAISAYIEWALHPLEKPKGSRKLSIPSDHRILKLVNLPVPVSTVMLPIDYTEQYLPSTMPCIQRFSPSFTTAGGIHLPKITDCIGTDGKVYRQLYKGGDDVRQDAVMEQVFAVANDLLASDDRTRSRTLSVRTYKVLPLTNDVGLLEFVRNSQPIGDWLTKAHERYNPNDMKVLDARRKLGEFGNADKAERIAAYQDVITKVKPVMRHFFTEKHYLPSKWFEMRLMYSRSTAVMSMVGFVLGLGDRHVSNIMIDTLLGELVPIDLGIAFEAGRSLPTPELVPFRLTRDIVDGFGISGVEGVFRKCSEETMRVLRGQASVLMTILEVFKFDPLQKWTASSSKVRRLQGSQAIDHARSHEGEQSSNLLTDADRAIATVAQKLNTELSVEYQVNDLILQATDIVNLALIFPGWQQAL